MILIVAGLASICLGAPVDATAAQCFGKEATIVGTKGGDDIKGTSGKDVIVVRAGNDRVRSKGGDDRVCLGAGNDGGAAHEGEDMIDAGPGDDELIGGIAAKFDPGDADTLIGGKGDDEMYGSAFTSNKFDLGEDSIAGGEGDDEVFGVRGEIDGGPGADVISGGGLVEAGDGNDSIFTSNDIGAEEELATVFGGEGDDSIAGASDESPLELHGGSGEDSISGGSAVDRLFGDADDDVLAGGFGEDLLDGGDGIDSCLDATATKAGCET